MAYNPKSYEQRVSETMSLSNAESSASRADQRSAEVSASVSRLELIVLAMWETIREMEGGEDKLYSKIDEVLANKGKYIRKTYDPLIINCPKCGKAIQESRKTPLVGKCMFCGQEVTFYPFSDVVSVKDDGASREEV